MKEEVKYFLRLRWMLEKQSICLLW
jgi:hypothetical protein